MRTGQALSIALLVAALQNASFAQQADSPASKPRRPPTIAAVFSVKSYKAMRESISYLTTVAGQPEAIRMLDMAIAAISGGHGLVGIDTDKPFGVALLSYGGQEAWPLVFIPISSQDKALQLLHAIGPTIMRKFGPMPYKLSDSLFLMGPALDHVDENNVPTPSRLINSNASKFDIAFTVNVPEIPMAEVEETFKKLDELVYHPSLPTSAAHRQGRALGAMLGKSLGRLVITGASEVTLGLEVAPKRKRLALEIALETRNATELHRLVESLTRNPSHLAGLVDPAGLASCLLNIPLSPRAKRQLLDLMPSDGEVPALLTRVDGESDSTNQQLLSLLRKTVESGRLELAVSLRGNPPGPLTVVGSAVIANAKALESFIVRQLQVDHNEKRLKFAREVTRFESAAIHSVSTPVPKEFEKYFGTNPKVHFAATSNMLHVAFGGLSLDSVRWALDRTGGTRRYSNRFAPFILQGRLQPWLALVSDPNVSDLRSKVTPSERISLVVTPASKSLSARLELQEGLLRLIGAQAQSEAGLPFSSDQ